MTIDASNLQDSQIKDIVMSHAELIPYQQELLLLLEMLRLINADMCLDIFDAIVIHKGDINLLKIKFPNSTGRSAYVKVEVVNIMKNNFDFDKYELLTLGV